MHTIRSVKWKYKQMYAFGDKEYFYLTLFKLPSVNAASMFDHFSAICTEELSAIQSN